MSKEPEVGHETHGQFFHTTRQTERKRRKESMILDHGHSVALMTTKVRSFATGSRCPSSEVCSRIVQLS
jgi:hypothetical protein